MEKESVKKLDNLLPFNGDAILNQSFLSLDESKEELERLLHDVPWRQQPIKMFGKEIMQPRLTTWYGDPGMSYTYSGLKMEPLAWNDSLIFLKEKLLQLTGFRFNSALLNLYRDGNDSMGWHRDNEKELGLEPVIASISLGATRKFQFRDYIHKGSPISIDLNSGSMLLMKGETQQYWEHRVPKSSGVSGERVNLTFRIVRMN